MAARTFITICTNNTYMKGVLLLKKSLEKTNSIYSLLCLVPNTFSNENVKVLENNNIIVKIIANEFIVDNDIVNRNKEGGNTHWTETFFKLNIFGLVEYEKIVFLDSDMLVVENIDELFELPHMTCCAAGKLYPGNENWIRPNSGLMVIEPSFETFEKIKNTYLKKSVKTFYGDQEVIQECYPEWPGKNELHLSEHYNLFYHYADYYSKKYNYKFTGGGGGGGGKKNKKKKNFF
jgi:alpha-N-acetylglucosamine transferase